MADDQQNSINEPFWLNDPKILISNNNWYKIFPTKNMNKNAILNSLTRLLILLMLIYLVLSSNIHYIYVFIIAILIIIVIYFLNNNNNKVNHTKENFTNTKKIIKTKKNNPFENITLDDIIDVDNLSIYSQRQFYKMPSRSIPDNKIGFAKWLYKLPKTCKEDSSHCLKYEDIRYSKNNPDIDSPDSDGQSE